MVKDLYTSLFFTSWFDYILLLITELYKLECSNFVFVEFVMFTFFFYLPNLSLNCHGVWQKDGHLLYSGEVSTICPLFHLAVQEFPLQLAMPCYSRVGVEVPSIACTATLKKKKKYSCIRYNQYCLTISTNQHKKTDVLFHKCMIALLNENHTNHVSVLCGNHFQSFLETQYDKAEKSTRTHAKKRVSHYYDLLKISNTK